MLAVLRRPQTKADHDVPTLRTLEKHARYGSRPDLPLVRLATIAPWGAKIFLVPFTPPTSEPHCTGTERACQGVSRAEAVAVVPASEPIAWSVARIEHGVAIVRAPTQGRWVAIVPDGVSNVTFGLGTRTPTVAVRGNVAAVQGRGGERIHEMVWYDAHGRVLRREHTDFG
jgi:hypothetical protein